MRFQDELLNAFRTQSDPDVRRYVLRQMLDLPVAVDSEEVIAVLRDEERAADSPLAAQATSAMTELLPRVAAVDFGFDARTSTFIEQPLSRTGTSKSRALAVADLERSGAGTLPQKLVLENEAWLAAGSHLLEPCLQPLLVRARAGGAERDASLRALARLVHHQARSGLEELAKREPRAAVALAHTGDPGAESAVLEALERKNALREELVRALARFPSGATRRVVERALDDRDDAMKIAGAMALEGFGEHDPVGMSRTLLTHCREVWPLVHAADSLGRAATPAAVPALIELYRATSEVLVQVTCVIAIANLGGDASVPFFLEVLDTGPDLVKAEALEALVLQLHPIADLKERAAKFVTGASPQLAMNAAIVLSRLEPELATRKVVEWLSSPNKGARLRGAYLMGYLRSSASLKVTAHLANADPSVPVRMELLRCLSRYAPEESGPALEACLAQPNPHVRARAIHLWARSGCVPGSEISRRLVTLLVKEADPLVRGRLVDLLGQAGDELARETLEKVLTADEEPVAARAAAAFGVLGDPAFASLVHTRARAAGPELRARAGVALFALGDLRGVEVLEHLVDEGGAGLEHGSRALEELCVLLTRLPASPRHKALQELLQRHLRTPEYEEFSRRRLAISSRAATSSAYRRMRKVDMDLTGTVAASSTAQLQNLDLKKIVAQARGDSGKVDLKSLGRFGLEPPKSRVMLQRERRRGAFAGVVLVAALLGLFGLLRSGGGAKPVVLGRGMAAMDGMLILGTVGQATGAQGRAAAAALTRNQVLKAPFTLATGKESRLTALIGPSPDDQVLLGADSTMVITSLTATPGAKNAYTLEISKLEGECTLDLKAGDPQLSLELPGATIEARRCHLRIKNTPERITVKLVSGSGASLKFAGQSSPLEAGKQRSWKPGDNPVTK